MDFGSIFNHVRSLSGGRLLRNERLSTALCRCQLRIVHILCAAKSWLQSKAAATDSAGRGDFFQRVTNLTEVGHFCDTMILELDL